MLRTPLTYEQICCRSCSGSGVFVLTRAPGLLLSLESGGNSTPRFLGKVGVQCHGLLGSCQFSLITALDLTSQLGGNGLFGLPLTTIFPLLCSSLCVPVTRQKKDDKGEREGRCRAKKKSIRILRGEKFLKSAKRSS